MEQVKQSFRMHIEELSTDIRIIWESIYRHFCDQQIIIQSTKNWSANIFPTHGFLACILSLDIYLYDYLQKKYQVFQNV